MVNIYFVCLLRFSTKNFRLLSEILPYVSFFGRTEHLGQEELCEKENFIDLNQNWVTLREKKILFQFFWTIVKPLFDWIGIDISNAACILHNFNNIYGLPRNSFLFSFFLIFELSCGSISIIFAHVISNGKLKRSFL